MDDLKTRVNDLIRRLYEGNHYFGWYDYKPEWIDYPYEERVQAVVTDVEERCSVNAYSWWERNYTSFYEVSASMSREIPVLRGGGDARVKAILLGGGSVFEFYVRLSVLGPYATPIEWRRVLLGPVRDGRPQGLDLPLCDGPPTESAELMQTTVLGILADRGIDVLPAELLRDPVAGMTGYLRFGREYRPTVFSCLFGEEQGTYLAKDPPPS